MVSVTWEDVHVADECPHWCALDHTGAETALLHEGETRTLAVSRTYDPRVPESVDVRVVQYLQDSLDGAGPDAPEWHPTVELAHHVGHRYRVINLSADEARRLAADLLACADQTGDGA